MKSSMAKITDQTSISYSHVLSLIMGIFIFAPHAHAGRFEKSKKAVPGQYIVLMNNEPSKTMNFNMSSQKTKPQRRVDLLANKHRAKMKHLWGSQDDGGFLAQMNKSDALRLAQEPDVAIVEEDSYIYLDETQVEWGLDRIDQRDEWLDGRYKTSSTGAGVNAYILDSGIRATHSEYKGRVRTGFNAVNDTLGTDDCDGHGTHVAGIVGGKTFGVAKGVDLIPVRVMNCDGVGTMSSVISGLNWIIKDQRSNGKPAVVNASIGGSASVVFDTVTSRVVREGITVVVAAGNDYDDACLYSPSRLKEAITVGALAENNTRADFSNFGSCVDIFAPGSSIISSFNGNDNDTKILSGTSMATPFVTGAAALYLSTHPKATPAVVANVLKLFATQDSISNLEPDTYNGILFTSFMLPGFIDFPIQVPKCSMSQELLWNTGFENVSLLAWTKVNSVVENNLTTEPHSGNLKILLNGAGKANVSSVYQKATLPAASCSVKLNFWLRVVTSERKGDPANDILYVMVTDEKNMPLKTLAKFSNQNASSDYLMYSFDLTQFKGKNINILFRGQENKSKATRFLIDDVSLTAVE